MVTTSTERRNRRKERRLWQDESYNNPSLGCMTCPEFSACGGLRITTKMFSCLAMCCGNPSGCDRVCRNQPDFVDRAREIDGFDLENVPRARPVNHPILPKVVPVIYHKAGRSTFFTSPVVSVSLYALVNRNQRASRFQSRDALYEHFLIKPDVGIVLTGTHKDRSIESWWSLEGNRRIIIRSLRNLGVSLVTSPNYSLFTDAPRWTDLHSMKRIAITHHEFLDEGVPAALHVNGRTDEDFLRWAEYLSNRPEIDHLAYEFTTGTGWPGRREKHARWLSDLARNVGRPLSLLLRGGYEVLPQLSTSFSHITVLETTGFMKTIKRKRAIEKSPAVLSWHESPTLPGQSLDDLLVYNTTKLADFLGDRI